MIYLIYSLGINTDIKEDCILDSIINGEFNEFEPIKMLKIGYTRDDEKTFKSRFGAYKLHNLGCKILCTIPELTEEDERRIQSYFRKFVFNCEGYNGIEWFYYDEEIINFFKGLVGKTEEEIRGIINNLPLTNYKNPRRFRIDGETLEKSNEIKKNLKLKTKQILYNVLKNEEEVDNIVVDLLKNEIYNIDSKFLNYIKTNYGESVIEDYNVRLMKLTKFTNLNTNLKIYYNLPSVLEKYKFLCEDLSSNRTEEEIDLFLSFIPDYDIVKSNYIALGPKKLRNLGYKKKEIEKELGNKMFDKNLVATEIFHKFNIGDSIPLIIIKDGISDIYSRLKYNKTPKATDLKDYFEVKDTKIWRDIDGSGIKKNVNAYNIISVKPEYQDLYSNTKVANKLAEEYSNFGIEE